MGAENDFCCEAVRKRHATLNNSVAGSGSEPCQKKKNGSYKDEMKQALAREKKIARTKVSFFDFWYECIDWEMIKLFYALLMLFFCTVGIAVALYLLYVFNFNEKLWYWYFPVREGFKHESLGQYLIQTKKNLHLNESLTKFEPLFPADATEKSSDRPEREQVVKTACCQMLVLMFIIKWNRLVKCK